MHAGSCSPLLGAPVAPESPPSTPCSYSHLVQPRLLPEPPLSWPPPGTDRPSRRPEIPQLPATPGQALRGDGGSPATALRNRERHHGNGQQRPGRRAAGSKLHEQSAFRACRGGWRRLPGGSCLPIVSVGRDISQPFSSFLLLSFSFCFGFGFACLCCCFGLALAWFGLVLVCFYLK